MHLSGKRRLEGSFSSKETMRWRGPVSTLDLEIWRAMQWLPGNHKVQVSIETIQYIMLIKSFHTWSRASLSSADCWVPANTRSLLESCILKSLIYNPRLCNISRVSILKWEYKKCQDRERSYWKQNPWRATSTYGLRLLDFSTYLSANKLKRTKF